MAPEMATGPVDARSGQPSDVYLLGAILYEIITGQPPHTGKTVDDLPRCRGARTRFSRPTASRRAARHRLEGDGHRSRPIATPAARDFQNAIRQYQAHTESIVLSSRAERELARGPQATTTTNCSPRGCSAFKRRIACGPATSGRSRDCPRRGWPMPRCARAKGDFDLAMSLLDTADRTHAAQIEAVAAAQRERTLRQQRLKNAKRIVKPGWRRRCCSLSPAL